MRLGIVLLDLCIVVSFLACSNRFEIYSLYKSKQCIENWNIELKNDSTYRMTRDFKEADKYYSYGKWSLVGDTLITTNNIQSPNSLVNLSYSTDATLPDSVIMIRIVEFNSSPLSAYLSTTQSIVDTNFAETDYLFGQKLIPISTKQIRLLILFVAPQQLSYDVNSASGNVVTLRVSTPQPKFYDLYESQKFILMSGKRKMAPISAKGGKCILTIRKGAEKL